MSTVKNVYEQSPWARQDDFQEGVAKIWFRAMHTKNFGGVPGAHNTKSILYRTFSTCIGANTHTFVVCAKGKVGVWLNLRVFSASA